MSKTIEVRVPDIGDFTGVPVIEVLVKPGDRIKKNDSLVTLESEKAAMEVPSSAEGIVESVGVKIGDKVSQGTILITVASDEGAPTPTNEGAAAPTNGGAAPPTNVVELRVPDIGDFHDIAVIEVLVKAGDSIEKESPLVTLESEKAAMDVPSTQSGKIESIAVKPGDKVSQGSLIATLRTTTSQASGPAPMPTPAPTPVTAPPTDAPLAASPAPSPRIASEAVRDSSGIVHASPGIRRFARELGVDLHGVAGSGPNARVTREDVQQWVKSALSAGPTTGGSGVPSGFANLPAWPSVDFAQFGEVERKPLPRIKKFSGPNLHRNWVAIPHITNYDEADITDLETFRNGINAEQAKNGVKITMLAFLIKAVVATLERFPDFNTSLDGEGLVYKRYYNIGFAADTPNGLIVPVLKNADAKGLIEIARETSELAAKARDGKLGMADMQGGTFTISSIGGIGGTQFTQIVNAPEVAILGATRSSTKPVWNGTAFVPRLLLPISVSYDHRVIDGAGAARFLVYLRSLLGDFKRILL